jgi:hypothetical protein
MRLLLLLSRFLGCFNLAIAYSGLYTQNGTDISWDEVLRSGRLSPLFTDTTSGVVGSTVAVNKSIVESSNISRRVIPQTTIQLHTVGNSFISRNHFHLWTRWYQEDGLFTQIFRLFTNETNVRNKRPLAARVETFHVLQTRPSPTAAYTRPSTAAASPIPCSTLWNVFSATYTIVKSHVATIFQLKSSFHDWILMVGMNHVGDLILLEHGANTQGIHDAASPIFTKVFAKNMTGIPFLLLIRDNGCHYEVYFKQRLISSSAYSLPPQHLAVSRENTSREFRWGMYVAEHPMSHDAMLFVSGPNIQQEHTGIGSVKKS